SVPAANESLVPVSEEDIVIDESAIDIPTEDAEGNPLPRREMRRLRQEAIDTLRQQKIAELAEEAERAQEDAPAAKPDTPPAQEQGVQPEPVASAIPTEPELHEVPTQAFS